jgi:hypothetical protein
MPVEPFRVGVFAAGAILVLGALLAGRGPAESAAARLRRGLRLGVAAAGVALMAWAALPYLARHQSPRALSTTGATATAPTPASGESEIDIVGLASSRLAACPHASASAVPDGGTASVAQMTAARNAFQGYDAATDAYVKCVDSAVGRLAGELKGTASAAQLQQLDRFGSSAHNTAIDQEQAVADQLNQQIRAFKAKHPEGER